jgi:acyl carrier protein
VSNDAQPTKQTLVDLLSEIFLIDPDPAVLGFTKDEIETWDSLGTVSLAVGVEEEFGYHMTPDEATSLQSVPELILLLETRGVRLT